MKVKSASEAARKWQERAGAASGDYSDGIQNPKESWNRATVAGADNYKTAVTKAANEGRFAKGVNAAGDDKWRDRSLSKGVTRFAQGVAMAQNDYAEGVQPFLETIERTPLPPRKPKGDPSNINRVGAIAAALHAKKLSMR